METDAGLVVEYTPSPTLAKFHASNALVRGIRGPIGSGKSVGCCWEIWSRAQEQRAFKGVRRSRWVATRNTYGELTTTTLKTWLDWFPEERFGKVVHGAPITHFLTWEHDDGTTVELEMWFLALDRPEHVKKLLSLEITGAWMNEAREQPKAILDGLTGRVGRYPMAQDGGASWSGVIMDTNPPDDDHWWYTLAEGEEKPADFKFFAQPAGDSDEAENLDWLLQSPETMALPVGHPKRRAAGRVYYERLKAGKTREWIKVYVKGQYGSVFDGKPVFLEWNDELHVKEIQPLQGVKLKIGLDFGLTPAAVITQNDARGRLLVLDELCGEDMGIKQFLEDLLIPHLMQVYPEHWAKKDEMIVCIADPAGAQKAQTDEKSCFDEVRAKKLRIRAAKTNAFLPRRNAVAWYLSKLSGGKPSFLVDPCCPVLRKGFNGGYKYRRIQVAGEERYTDEPLKNKYSHPHDALQYVALESGGSQATEPPPRRTKVVEFGTLDREAGY